jgi:hypothetical protein
MSVSGRTGVNGTERDGRTREREGKFPPTGFGPVGLDEGGEGPVNDDKPGGGSCVGVAMRWFDGELRRR